MRALPLLRHRQIGEDLGASIEDSKTGSVVFCRSPDGSFRIGRSCFDWPIIFPNLARLFERRQGEAETGGAAGLGPLSVERNNFHGPAADGSGRVHGRTTAGHSPQHLPTPVGDAQQEEGTGNAGSVHSSESGEFRHYSKRAKPGSGRIQSDRRIAGRWETSVLSEAAAH